MLGIMFLLFTIIPTTFAQYYEYYKNLKDKIGNNIEPNLQNLDNVAEELVMAFPTAFRDSFRVYSTGFYLHTDDFQGGIPQEFQRYIEKAEDTTKYYFVIGREGNTEKLLSKFWIALNLPNTDSLACITEDKLIGLNHEILASLNNNLGNGNLTFLNEINGMNKLKEFIIRVQNCCDLEGFNGNASSRSLIDTSLLSIDLCIDNSCQNDPPNSIAIISPAPYMPQISFKLNYTGDTICTTIKAELRITFKRNTAVTARNRRDSIQIIIDNVEMGYNYLFNTGNQFQGGRAQIILWDQLNSKIKSFKFTIKGQNPTAMDVYDYIDERNYSDDFWFLKQIATHENGAHPQTLGSKLWQFNEFNATKEDLQLDWDEYSRCPILSLNRDGGWGLTQLTLPIPKKITLWSWKSNIDTAYHLLTAVKAYEIRNTLTNNWLPSIVAWNTLHPSDEVTGHTDYEHGGMIWIHALNEIYNGVTDIENHFPDTLTNGERSFLDGMIIKYYNGIGGGNDDHHFYYLVRPTNQKPYWAIDPTADYGGINYYVRDISETFIPTN